MQAVDPQAVGRPTAPGLDLLGLPPAGPVGPAAPSELAPPELAPPLLSPSLVAPSLLAPELLAQQRLLHAATDQEVAVLAEHASTRSLARGQVLLLEGERSDHLYVVLSGRFKVFVSSDRGDELVLSLLGPGDHLGEISVLDRLARSATVQATADSELLVLPGEPLRALLASSAPVALSWATSLATEVRRLTGSTADLVFLDLPRRLVKLLLEGGEREVRLGSSQTELAARLGVARQSLNRALSALQQRGWLLVDGTAVVLRDRPALERFARS